MEDRGLTRLWRPRSVGPMQDGSLLDRVMLARGLDGEHARGFLEPALADLHDPALMPGLERAAARLLRAARDREPIVIYGDYDVDGVTASAILFRTLRSLVPESVVSCYVPHRLDEGYGLNAEAMRSLADSGARVIVSVDCGVTATEPADAARQAGVDLIITDHHTPPDEGESWPDAYAIVHPLAPGHEHGAYPFPDLCGAGVAYKLAWRLCTLHAGSDRVTPESRGLLINLLALSALGVIADVVPLRGENRVMARYGLSMVKRSPIVGLAALVRASGLDGEEIDAESVGFKLGPRLNAVGRLGHASEAVTLLTTEDKGEAARIAESLTAINDKRRRVEAKILEQAKAMVEAAGMHAGDSRSIVLMHEDWHPGVVGIVCSRLVERYARPAILLCERDGQLSGSGRSVDGFDLHAGLAACARTLTGFGGHTMAAGLRLPSEKLEEFREAFDAHARIELGDQEPMRLAEYDTEARLSELNESAVRSLETLAPFGRENPRVRVLVRGLRLHRSPEVFGKTGAHAGLTLAEPGGGRGIRTVGWNWAGHARDLRAGDGVDALLSPKVSSYSGRVEPELVDLKVCAPSAV